jgi:hypothetical protein
MKQPQMKPSQLPCVTDEPRAAFSNGWWSGLAVGFINGIALAVLICKIAK